MKTERTGKALLAHYRDSRVPTTKPYLLKQLAQALLYEDSEHVVWVEDAMKANDIEYTHEELQAWRKVVPLGYKAIQKRLRVEEQILRRHQGMSHRQLNDVRGRDRSAQKHNSEGSATEELHILPFEPMHPRLSLEYQIQLRKRSVRKLKEQKMPSVHLKPDWEQLRPHQIQSEAWRCEKRFVGLFCGRGSGKTVLARRRSILYLQVKKPWHDPIYFYALPTYNQAKRVAWAKLKMLIPDNWVKRIYEGDLIIRTVFGSSLHVVGMDKPQRIEGDQWDGGVIDESSDVRPGAFALSVRPAMSHKEGWVWRIGVPKRVGVGALEYREFCELGTSGADPDVAAFTWPSSGVMSKKEIESAKRQLSSDDFKEQYEAAWLTVSGAMFYGYHRELSVDDTLCHRPNEVLIIGCDFNVTPMSWVVCHKNKQGTGLDAFDEIRLNNTNTPDTLKVLQERYGPHGISPHRGQIVFVGDATARSRTSHAAGSDYATIANFGGFPDKRVLFPQSNPQRVDRYASVNALLCNAMGDRRMMIHPRCKSLLRDLLLCAYKEGTRDMDTTNADLGHMSDAMGYVVHMMYPSNLMIAQGTTDIATITTVDI